MRNVIGRNGDFLTRSSKGMRQATAERDTTPMTADVQHRLLPSVATVLRNHLLSQIREESGVLSDENVALEAVRASLATVKIRFGEGEHIMCADMSQGVVVTEEAFGAMNDNGLDELGRRKVYAYPFHKFPSEKLAGKKLLLLLSNATPVPLSELAKIEAIRANHTVGALTGMGSDIYVDGEGPFPRVYLSEELVVQGHITGLSADIVGKFKTEELGADEIFEYVQSGSGLQAEHAFFKPHSLHMDISPEILEVLEALRPSMCCEDPDHGVEAKTRSKFTVLDEGGVYEKARLKILGAIGDNEAQLKVLEEHRASKVENNCLKAMGDILGTIELPHSNGTLTLHLKEGCRRTINGRDDWAIFCAAKDNFALKARDLCNTAEFHPTLSGIPMYISQDAIAIPAEDDPSTSIIRFSYSNGATLFGQFDSSVELEDFPESDTVMHVKTLVFPFSLVKEAIDTLGIDYGDDESEEYSEYESEGTLGSDEE